MKYVLLIALIALLGITGCTAPALYAESGDTDVNVVITDNGISIDKCINIDNFHPGARAEVSYSIRNASHAALQPVLFINTNGRVEDYSKSNGAITYEPAFDWIDIPDIPEINPGETVNALVSIEMPKKSEIDTNKFGFQIAAAAEGKQIQIAVGSWWIISMR